MGDTWHVPFETNIAHHRHRSEIRWKNANERRKLERFWHEMIFFRCSCCVFFIKILKRKRRELTDWRKRTREAIQQAMWIFWCAWMQLDTRQTWNKWWRFWWMPSESTQTTWTFSTCHDLMFRLLRLILLTLNIWIYVTFFVIFFSHPFLFWCRSVLSNANRASKTMRGRNNWKQRNTKKKWKRQQVASGVKIVVSSHIQSHIYTLHKAKASSKFDEFSSHFHFFLVFVPFFTSIVLTRFYCLDIWIPLFIRFFSAAFCFWICINSRNHIYDCYNIKHTKAIKPQAFSQLKRKKERYRESKKKKKTTKTSKMLIYCA